MFTEPEKLTMAALVRQTRQSHHISLADATGSNRSTLSRFENGRSDISMTMLQDVFERIGLSFFDLHVQTNTLTPLWQQTAEKLYVCIAQADAQSATNVIAEYEANPAAVKSPLHTRYLRLFGSMQQLCHPTAVQPTWSEDAQQALLVQLGEAKTWHILDFTSCRYNQWFLSSTNAAQAYRIMREATPPDALQDSSYLYRLAFVDTAIACAQHLLLAGSEWAAILDDLHQVALISHMNVERQFMLDLLHATAEGVQTGGSLNAAREKIAQLSEIGLTAKATQLSRWLDACEVNAHG